MLMSLVSAAAAMSLGMSDGPLTVSASIQDQPLEVGGVFYVDVDMQLGAGWSASEAGVPGYIVQLDAPVSATPVGDVLSARQLARNGFMQAPHERLLKGDHAAIEFTLESEPQPGDVIGINVLAYLVHDDGSAAFARRHVELPVKQRAAGMSDEQATVSTWGLDTAGVQIGDKAPAFDLPDKDGELTSLADAFEDSDVILTTYRAFW